MQGRSINALICISRAGEAMKKEVRVNQRADCVYFWGRTAWALAIQSTISQFVKRVHSHCITATIFSCFYAFAIMVQRSVILVCPLSLFFHSPFMNAHTICTCIHGSQWSQSHKPWDAYIYFLRRRALTSPARKVWPEDSPQRNSQSPSWQQHCQRWGYRKYYILLEKLFVSPSFPRQSANKCCISGALYSSALS